MDQSKNNQSLFDRYTKSSNSADNNNDPFYRPSSPNLELPKGGGANSGERPGGF